MNIEDLEQIMLITKEDLEQHNFCEESLIWFNDNFKNSFVRIDDILIESVKQKKYNITKYLLKEFIFKERI